MTEWRILEFSAERQTFIWFIVSNDNRFMVKWKYGSFLDSSWCKIEQKRRKPFHLRNTWRINLSYQYSWTNGINSCNEQTSCFFLGSVWIFDCQIWFRMELILFDKTIFKTITIIRNTNDSCSNAQGQACLNHDFCPIAWNHFVKCLFRIHLDTQKHTSLTYQIHQM